MQTLGVYCYPGVPNTTQGTKETYQNYGTFKSNFRQNLKTFSQARFDLDKTLMITDLPLIVFVGKNYGIADVSCRDVFIEGFSIDANFNYWKKCGAVTLPRSCLLSDTVRHEVIVEPNRAVGVDTDP